MKYHAVWKPSGRPRGGMGSMKPGRRQLQALKSRGTIPGKGKVVEVCAEPGEFTFDASTEPSIFSGNLGESIGQVFQQIGKRFMNPLLKVKRPAARKDEPKKEESEKALTAKELAYVLSCVENEPLKWRVYMNLAADSGARRGELCGLWWSDIDWRESTITIRRNLQYTAQAGIYETSPKNGKVRVVDIGPETLGLLRQFQAKQAGTCLSKYVFTQDGTPAPMHPQSPTRYFKKFGTKYSIPNFHPHLLRHSSASIALTNGGDVVSTSERLGHSDTAVTLRMYAHANQESIRRNGQIVRDALKAQNG